jgi:hypothetical protein
MNKNHNNETLSTVYWFKELEKKVRMDQKKKKDLSIDRKAV